VGFFGKTGGLPFSPRQNFIPDGAFFQISPGVYICLRKRGPVPHSHPLKAGICGLWDAWKIRNWGFIPSRIIMTFGATTISAIYKDRWQIELFSRAIKRI